VAIALANLEPATAHEGGIAPSSARAGRAARAVLAALVLVVPLALLALPGCGEDEVVVKAGADAAAEVLADGGGAGGEDVGARAGLQATATGATSGARVELAPTLLADGTLEVRVLIRDVDDLLGLAAHLRYDAGALELVSSKGHPVLGGSGWEPRTLIHVRPGRVLLGGARVRVGGSPYAPLQGAKVGNQVWATLIFRKVSAGDTALSFDPAHLLARAADYSVVPLQWQGLTIQGGGGR